MRSMPGQRTKSPATHSRLHSKMKNPAAARLLARLCHTPHEITTVCSHRREEVDRRDAHFCPPPYVGGYARCEISRLGRLRMQRDPVAFGITDDRAKAIGSDGVFVLENFSAALLDSSNRVIQPALDAQINQRAMLGRLVIFHLDQASGVLMTSQ